MRAAVPVGVELVVLANGEKLDVRQYPVQESVVHFEVAESTEKVISLYVAAL